MLVLGHWVKFFVQSPTTYQELNNPTTNENRHTEGNP